MLRAVLLAGTSWAGASPLGLIVAQLTGGGDAPTPLTSLVFGALGSSPASLILAWVVTRGDKERAELRVELTKEREENRRLNELRPEAAKEMAVLLERAASTFAEVKAGMDVTLTKARPDEVNSTLLDLKDLLQQYTRGEGRRS